MTRVLIVNLRGLRRVFNLRRTVFNTESLTVVEANPTLPRLDYANSNGGFIG